MCVYIGQAMTGEDHKSTRKETCSNATFSTINSTVIFGLGHYMEVIEMVLVSVTNKCCSQFLHIILKTLVCKQQILFATCIILKVKRTDTDVT